MFDDYCGGGVVEDEVVVVVMEVEVVGVDFWVDYEDGVGLVGLD